MNQKRKAVPVPGFFFFFCLPVKLCIHRKPKLSVTSCLDALRIISDISWWVLSTWHIILRKQIYYLLLQFLCWNDLEIHEKAINTWLSFNLSHSTSINNHFYRSYSFSETVINSFVSPLTHQCCDCELEGTSFPLVSHFSISQHPPERWGCWFLHARATLPSLLLTSMSLCRGHLI